VIGHWKKVGNFIGAGTLTETRRTKGVTIQQPLYFATPTQENGFGSTESELNMNESVPLLPDEQRKRGTSGRFDIGLLLPHMLSLSVRHS
jgi:hypothetical protein